MKLGFDVDDVVADLTSALIKYIYNTYNITLSDEELRRYSVLDNIFTSDKEVNEKIVIDLAQKSKDSKFQSTIKPYKDAVECIKKLRRSGHTLHYISSRNIGAEYETAKWFRKHHIPFDSIHSVGLEQEKGMLGRALNLDFYIDDLEEHLESMMKYKKRWRKGLALFTRKWNKDSIDASKFIRLDNWTQISRHLGIHKR